MKSTKAVTPTTYVKQNIPRVSAMVDRNIDRKRPLRNSNEPITIPSRPVVKIKIRDSSILIIAIIIADDKNTINPRDMLVAAAIAVGNVLKGLIANPMEGRNIGADWNITANAIYMAPIQMNLLGFCFNNISSSYYVNVS